MTTTWSLQDDALILSCIKDSTSLCDGLNYSAKVLNRTISSVTNRYYQTLRRAKLTKRAKSKCIVIDKEAVSNYSTKYRESDDVTIIILHIRGKKSFQGVLVLEQLKYVAPFIIINYIAIKKTMKKIICTACDGTGSVATHTKVIVCPRCEGIGLDKPLPKTKFKSKLKKE